MKNIFNPKIYGKKTEVELAKEKWTFKDLDRKHRKIFISPDTKYKVCLWPNTIYGYVVKNKWYIKG